MKKVSAFLFIAFLLSININLWAAPIDSAQAIIAAKHFFAAKSNLRSGQLPDVRISSVQTSASGNIPYYYILSNRQQAGWIILSGDDRILPVIAYSETGMFNGETNPSFDWWMAEKAKEIEAILSAYRNESNLRSAKVHQGWTELLSGAAYNEPAQNTLRSATAYTPGSDLLAGIKWNQSNSWAPTQAGNNSPAGCVATAMGQILKYWGRKNNLTHLQGKGAYEYIDHAGNNTLRRVDYSTRTYNLAAMSEDTPSDDIRNLLYDLGVSVRMSYSSGGSGALNGMIPSALFSHFGFKPAEYVDTSYYVNNWQGWENKIVQEINAERPVIYGGNKTSGEGHSFVLSGYRINSSSNNKEYYFNWGWSGQQNGWFVLRLSDGNPVIDYRVYQDAVFGLEPDENGDALGYSISDVVMKSRNNNCYMLNKFAIQNTPGEFTFKLTNNAQDSTTIPIAVTFYANSANGMNVSLGGLRYAVRVAGNTTEEILIDASQFINYWNSKSYADVNCDIGTVFINSDDVEYTVDIGRNPHVIQRVSAFNCESGISSPEITAGKITLYPNPAHDYIFIRTDENIDPDSISIINVFGEKLSPAAVMEIVVDGKIRVDISGLPSGVYFIHAGKQSWRFIKK